MKKAVLTYGRFNPPHIGHERLLHCIFEEEGDHFIVVSHTQDAKKNPLPVHLRIKYLQKMFPEHGEFFYAASKECPTLFQFAEKLYKAGYTHLHVVLGEDRMPQFQKGLTDYNGKFNAEGKGYSFSLLTFAIPGIRDADKSGTEGASSTKMREYALQDDLEKFLEFLPVSLRNNAKEIMEEIKKASVK